MGDMAGMSTNHNLCVYCGSGPGLNPAYVEAARTLGDARGQRYRPVYGGGSLGLMGEVARATLAGGRVIGVIPEFLVQRERMLTEVSEFIVTATMHERKMTMFERSAGFVALPGGMARQELVEVSTWAKSARMLKPIILANIADYWAPPSGCLATCAKSSSSAPGSMCISRWSMPPMPSCRPSSGAFPPCARAQ